MLACAQSGARETRELSEHVVRHLYRSLPPEHAGDLDRQQVRSAVSALVDARRDDLLVRRVEDEQGLAAILLLKERRSALSREREGFLYCLVPCRWSRDVADATIRCLNGLVQSRGWAALRVALFAADLPALERPVEGTNLELGWMVTRKRLRPAEQGAPDLPRVTRPARREDIGFVHAGWRDAYLAGLQQETGWQSEPAALRGADVDLARLLSSEHCALIVIESDGERVGFVAAEVGRPQELTGRPECHLHDCYVAPQWRGRGYAHKAIRDLERFALERGCRYLSGTVAGPGPEKIRVILTQIERHGWVHYQSVFRCRAPLLKS